MMKVIRTRYGFQQFIFNIMLVKRIISTVHGLNLKGIIQTRGLVNNCLRSKFISIKVKFIETSNLYYVYSKNNDSTAQFTLSWLYE